MEEKLLPTPAKYASCPYDGKILEYYQGQFDCVYILLHPFIRPVSINIERFDPETWLTKQEILNGCEPVLWQKISEISDLNKSDIDVGLRTSIWGLNKEFANADYAETLIKIAKSEKIILPTEGKLPPLLENKIFEAIKELGHKWLWVGDEFCTERKLHWIDDLIEGEEIPCHGCIFTPDHSLLVTTHWDSHCSFLCSSKEAIESILSFHKFEGFYCTEKTEVYWGVYEI